MLRSLTSAVSGLQSFQAQMDVIGNNIANVNTTSFKGSRTEFSDAFSQTLRGSSPASPTSAGQNALQIGSGVTTSAIQTLNTQGALSRTGVTTDMAIAGDGYFIVRDPSAGTNLATRDGSFHLDANGYLVTSGGHRVQGTVFTGDPAVETPGDIIIDADGRVDGNGAALSVLAWSVDKNGGVNVTLSDSTTVFQRGTVHVQQFANPQALMKQGSNLFSGLGNANPLAPAGTPGTEGRGEVVSGALELSNVDLASEFSSLIISQRAFQATSRVITTGSEVLQELVNLKR